MPMGTYFTLLAFFFFYLIEKFLMEARGLRCKEDRFIMKIITGFEKSLRETEKYWQLQHNLIAARVEVCVDAMFVNFVEVFLSFLEALEQCFLMQLPTVRKMFCICCNIVATSHICLLST